MFVSFLTIPLDTNYFRMYWIDLHQIFRIGRHTVGHDHSDLLFAIARGTLLWYPSLARIGEKWHTSPLICALALHNGWEDRNLDAHVNTADHPSTSDKNLVNVGPVTPEFCTFCRRVCAGELHAGLGHAFLVFLYSLFWNLESIVTHLQASLQSLVNSLTARSLVPQLYTVRH